jgi:protein TonB
LHHHAAPIGLWARATATYDRRFWVALSVSAGHLLFLLYLLVGLFGLQFSATVAQAEEVFEVVPLSEGPPGDPGESGGSPAPPAALPPPPTPSLAAISTMPTIPAPNLKVPSPTLNFSATPASSTMFGSQFSGFAGSGYGTGAGAGMGAGGYGTGRGGGGKPLIPLSTARPQITEYAYRRGIEGWVIVQFTVTTGGNVRDIRIVDAEPKGLFEAAAVESISHWIYPRMERESQVTQKVEFKLEDYKYNWK